VDQGNIPTSEQGPTSRSDQANELVILRAIADAPGNEAAQLLYVDWLEERGDPRAEYLRLLLAFVHTLVLSPESAKLLIGLHKIQLRERIDRRWILLMCRDRILRLLRAFQAGVPRDDWSDHESHRELARRCAALPIYADMGGTILLRPDGEILVVDDEEELQPLTHRGWRLIGLASAAEFFPELRPLLPPRPFSANSCPQCGGEGVERWWVQGKKGITPCGKCWGQGWLPTRPPHAPSCAKCGGKGRLRVGPNGEYETSCGDCCGWGWVFEDPT
jgi:uncharacterized protein (TIGR02996 family)